MTVGGAVLCNLLLRTTPRHTHRGASRTTLRHGTRAAGTRRLQYKLKLEVVWKRFLFYDLEKCEGESAAETEIECQDVYPHKHWNSIKKELNSNLNVNVI